MFGHQAPDLVFKEALQYYMDRPKTDLNKALVKRAGLTDATQLLSQAAVQPDQGFNRIQNYFREQYGRQDSLPPLIGDHPDFEHLKETGEHEYCGVVTMFMDIEGSTKLGLHYPLDRVFKIKNSFIQVAIAIIRAFDGHVHRIMGDAVMAFFGGAESDPDQDVVNACNCAAQIMHLSKKGLIPLLKADFDQDFGIRIGLDYGPDTDVLWSSYGFLGADEVTATSYYVDVSSKLQHQAGRNKIMIGHSLRTRLDLPDELASIKQFTKGGETMQDLYVTPNYTKPDGTKHNYRMYVFEWEEYLMFAPYNAYILQPTTGVPKVLPYKVEICNVKGGEPFAAYKSCSSVLKPGLWLKVVPHIPKTLGSFRMRCAVENHGSDALHQGGPDRGNHENVQELDTDHKKENFVHWEVTRYRGLHYLIVEGKDDRGNNYKTNVGVFIA